MTSKKARDVYRSLVEKADRNFLVIRDLPTHVRYGSDSVFRKAFKAYTRLWRFQQENRANLVESGLQRWEIGEIASRIGQLYYCQYLRTGETRFLIESYLFYDAIVNRDYFKGCCSDLLLAFKELRFVARFLIVCLVLNRVEKVNFLADRLRSKVEECRSSFEDKHFKEWKRVTQDVVRFLSADAAFMTTRPFSHRVCATSPPQTSNARFPKTTRALKLQDALLTSYHQNEVKFTELTLDTFRMLQCLEWEISESIFQAPSTGSCSSGVSGDLASAANRLNLFLDNQESILPSSPRKTLIYRPPVTHLIAVMATLCEELSSDGILLIYISAPGKVTFNCDSSPSVGPVNSFRHPTADRRTRYSSKVSFASKMNSGNHNSSSSPRQDNGNPNGLVSGCLCFGSHGKKGLNSLYPEDIIPFTRRPLFLIIDSDDSHSFKVLHGSERGEAAILLLSPGLPVSLDTSATDPSQNGSQFTFFLTSPFAAFLQLLGLSAGVIEPDMYKNAEKIVSTLLSEWETLLCTSDCLDQTWEQVLDDLFLRRLIVRYIFCRSVLSLFVLSCNNSKYLPLCFPNLPVSFSPTSTLIQNGIHQLAASLGVANHFTFSGLTNHLSTNGRHISKEIEEIS